MNPLLRTPYGNYRVLPDDNVVIKFGKFTTKRRDMKVSKYPENLFKSKIWLGRKLTFIVTQGYETLYRNRKQVPSQVHV